MKKVLITGGNSGLGLAVTKKLLNKNYQVTILGKDKVKLEQINEKLDSKNLSTIQCDLRNYEEIKEKLNPINELDILINSAGIIAFEKLEEH